MTNAVTLFFVQNDKLQKIERYYFHDKKNKKLQIILILKRLSFGKDCSYFNEKKWNSPKIN